MSELMSEAKKSDLRFRTRKCIIKTMSGTTEQPEKLPMQPKLLWNVTELAYASGKSKQWVRQLLRDGEDLSGHKVGRDWVVADEEARKWLEDLWNAPA